MKYGANINQVENTNGWTALIWAAKQGHQETVIALLDHQAAIGQKDYTGKTAKHWASEGGYQTIVDILEKSNSYHTSK